MRYEDLDDSGRRCARARLNEAIQLDRPTAMDEELDLGTPAHVEYLNTAIQYHAPRCFSRLLGRGVDPREADGFQRRPLAVSRQWGHHFPFERVIQAEIERLDLADALGKSTQPILAKSI